MSRLPGRRSFLSIVTALAGLPAMAQAQRSGTVSSSSAFDLTRLDQMKGQHKQLYDLGAVDLAEEPRAFRFLRNFLDTFRDEFHLEFSAINTAVGISNSAFRMNATDRPPSHYSARCRERPSRTGIRLPTCERAAALTRLAWGQGRRPSITS